MAKKKVSGEKTTVESGPIRHTLIIHIHYIMNIKLYETPPKTNLTNESQI